MRRDLLASAIAVVALTLIFGLAYPLAMTVVGKAAFPGAAGGSKIELDGATVGSKLIGQTYEHAVASAGGKTRSEPDPAYFQGRPSVTGNDPSVTYFNNLGPNQRALVRMFRRNLAAYLAMNRPYDPALTAPQVPNDAVQTSASGVDPHISPANAEIQAHRIAALRRAPLERVDQLIDEHTDGRGLGVFGEPGVNVLELNIALDQEFPVR